MNTRFKWLFLILLFAAPAYAQNVRVDNVTFSSVQGFPFLPGATITICTAAATGLPCSPTVAGTCLSISDATCNQSATLTSDAFGNYGFWIQPGSYTYTVTKAGFGGFGPRALTLACQPTATCTITGAQTINANLTVGGPSPWYDVSANGVDCTGVADSTTALANLTTTAKAVSNARIFFPPGCQIKVSTWNLSNIATGAPFNIEGGVNGSVSNNPTITFTGNCNGTFALQEATSSQIEMKNISFKFPNATSGPCHDLTGASLLKFTRVSWTGSGQTVGPLINDVNTTNVTFDGWSTCGNTSICITGPNTISGSPFSDVTTIRNMQFSLIGTRAINDPSVNWNVEDNLFSACNGSNFVQAVGFDTSNILVSNFNFSGNDIVGGTCVANTAITYINLPLPTFVTSATFNGNLIVGNASSPAQTFLTLANNIQAQARGNQFEDMGTVFAVGTGDTLNADSNSYLAPITTFLTGTPQTGRVEDNNGVVHNYLNGVDSPNVQRGTVSGSNYTNATTTASNITGLSFSVKANTQYTMTCQLPFSPSAASAGLDITVTGPSTPTFVNFAYTEMVTSTTFQYANQIAFGSKLVGSNAVATGAEQLVTLVMNLTNGANAGTVQVQGSATGVGTVTVPIGAFCQLQ